jgi:hypothetical protein
MLLNGCGLDWYKSASPESQACRSCPKAPVSTRERCFDFTSEAGLLTISGKRRVYAQSKHHHGSTAETQKVMPVIPPHSFHAVCTNSGTSRLEIERFCRPSPSFTILVTQNAETITGVETGMIIICITKPSPFDPSSMSRIQGGTTSREEAEDPSLFPSRTVRSETG